MKIRKIINKVENYKQPNWDMQQQLEWINELDRFVLEDIIKKRVISIDELKDEFHCVRLKEGSETEYEYITEHTSIDEEVFCPDRYCAFYTYWLLAKIDEVNGDLTRFENDMALYEAYYLEYGNYVNRSYRHFNTKARY